MRDRLIELLKGAETKVSEELSRPLALEEWLGIYADHILANGVIVPPCKAGDHIYLADKRDGSITEFVVHSISAVCLKDTHKSVTVQFIDGYGYREFHYQFNSECFGKTVFLTKEEAEKALKEREWHG